MRLTTTKATATTATRLILRPALPSIQSPRTPRSLLQPRRSAYPPPPDAPNIVSPASSQNQRWLTAGLTRSISCSSHRLSAANALSRPSEEDGLEARLAEFESFTPFDPEKIEQERLKRIKKTKALEKQRRSLAREQRKFKLESKKSFIIRYFSRYPKFFRDVRAPLWDEFYRLAKENKWEEGGIMFQRACSEFEHHLVRHFDEGFGVEICDVQNWEFLLKCLKVTPESQNIVLLQKQVLKLLFNPMDLLDSLHTQLPVKLYDDIDELRKDVWRKKAQYPVDHIAARSFQRAVFGRIVTKHMFAEWKRGDLDFDHWCACRLSAGYGYATGPRNSHAAGLSPVSTMASRPGKRYDWRPGRSREPFILPELDNIDQGGNFEPSTPKNPLPTKAKDEKPAVNGEAQGRWRYEMNPKDGGIIIYSPQGKIGPGPTLGTPPSPPKLTKPTSSVLKWPPKRNLPSWMIRGRQKKSGVDGFMEEYLKYLP